jgi:hypothetical protein
MVLSYSLKTLHSTTMVRSLLLAALAILEVVAGASVQTTPFYKDGHFDNVAKLSSLDDLTSFVETNIAQSKTVFVRWVASEG